MITKKVRDGPFEFPSEVSKKVYDAIKLNRKAKYSWLADNLGVSEATIKRDITTLKELGLINAQHSKVKGEWQLIEKKWLSTNYIPQLAGLIGCFTRC